MNFNCIILSLKGNRDKPDVAIHTGNSGTFEAKQEDPI